MGLDLYAKGLQEAYSGSYTGYFMLRVKLAEKYSKELGETFKVLGLLLGRERSELIEKVDKLVNEAPEGLAILLTHSDCDGKLTP